MLTTEDKKEIEKIVEKVALKIIKDVLMPTLHLMDEKSNKIDKKVDRGFSELGDKIDSVDIKVDEIALNQKKDRRRIETLEKSFRLS